MKIEIHSYFSNNKAGIKQNYNHLIRHAEHIYIELMLYAEKHTLYCKNLSELAYLYVNDITNVSLANSTRKRFFRYTKGYYVNEYVQDYQEYPSVLEYIKNDTRKRLSSLEQRIMHKHYYANEIKLMFNNFGHTLTARTKIWMLIHKLQEPVLCTECLNYAKPRKSTSGFRLTCSDECEVDRTNAKRKKLFILSNGEVVTIMGYEGFVYNKLLTFTDNNKIVYGTLKIKTYTSQIRYLLDNVQRRYYPDFYIPEHKKIIEVKSTYTYEADFKKNIEKAKACIDAGFVFEFWIHNIQKIYQMSKDYKLTIINYQNYTINA